MPTKHIVKSYDDDLNLLNSKISEMGSEVEDQISKAAKALLSQDGGLADVVIVCDGKVNVLQVTNLTEKTMELRALMSAKDSPTAWDLRVHVREQRGCRALPRGPRRPAAW